MPEPSSARRAPGAGPQRLPRSLAQCFALAFLAVTAAWTVPAAAGEFAILPLRLHLDRSTRATEVTIRNQDTAPLRMQAQAMTWQQDTDGKDVYAPTDDLIFFPRALEIPPGESRIVRVGVRAAPVTREETYRLFLEQLPPATPEAAPAGASLRVLLRVGVPVFVAPAQVERKASIDGPEIRAGQARWSVANEGNVHFVADRVELKAMARDGTTLFTRQFQERYFLAGARKPLLFELPREACGQLAAIEVSVAGENVDLARKVNVEPGACN
jgi:fimbrial chaperone protein